MITTNIHQNGYTNCIGITNKDTSVILEPDCGGRVLSYSYKDVDVIYKNSLEDGYLLSNGKAPISNLSPCAGRCDIGPEMTTPNHDILWLGKWNSKILNDYSVELTSQPDNQTGVQLRRVFQLHTDTSELIFTQYIKNISGEVKNYFHWSRTFCKGGGIAIAPVNPKSRFPKGYLTYGPGDMIDYMPEQEKHVVVNDGILQIIGPPLKAKFAMDLTEGWLAYLTKDHRLLIKKFNVYPDRVYGEIAANNMSFWYNQEEMCEVEPIGPVEHIKPGKEVSFTEKWYLKEFDYPGIQTIDAKKLLSEI